MITLLIVDDSPVICLLLEAIFRATPDITVVGTAHDGLDAIHLVKLLKPDVVTMDIRMPKMDGIEATRLIMRECPCPIIIVSSYVDDVVLGSNFNAIDAGALVCIAKPVSPGSDTFKSIQQELIETVRAMAGMKLVTRRAPLLQVRKTDSIEGVARKPFCKDLPQLVAIGSSIGGPQALQMILSHLPADFSVPIVVTQHISKGFIDGLVSWLSKTSRLSIQLPEDNQPLLSGHVYFAPDDTHFTVDHVANTLCAKLITSNAVNGFRPSVTPLFQSVARTCGSTAIGVMLTGMGNDGAEGLLAMRRTGAHTIAEDEASCIVYGMPAAAIALDAVDQTVNLVEMARYLQMCLLKE